MKKTSAPRKDGAPTARYGAADPRIRCYQVAGTWLTETLNHAISQAADIGQKSVLLHEFDNNPLGRPTERDRPEPRIGDTFHQVNDVGLAAVGPELELILVEPGAAPRAEADDERVAAMVVDVFERSLPPALRDDRFDRWRPGPTHLAALAVGPDGPIGYLGGPIDGGVLRLDGLIAPEPHAPLPIATALYQALASAMAGRGIRSVELWGKPAEPWHRALAEANGFSQFRSLHQLRCVLPVDAKPIESRAFRPGEDDERLVTVNNRAFSSHPDQGTMTVAGLVATSTEPWFDPEGIRLHDDPETPDRLAGFCWTKIHPPLADGEPALGEIYVIGIDPDHHGKGLGVPMTAAGLHWMAGRGLTTGMLYVEADNHPALRTYEKLGFTRHRTDVAWSRPFETEQN